MIEVWYFIKWLCKDVSFFNVLWLLWIFFIFGGTIIEDKEISTILTLIALAISFIGLSICIVDVLIIRKWKEYKKEKLDTFNSLKDYD